MSNDAHKKQKINNPTNEEILSKKFMNSLTIHPKDLYCLLHSKTISPDLMLRNNVYPIFCISDYCSGKVDIDYILMILSEFPEILNQRVIRVGGRATNVLHWFSKYSCHYKPIIEYVCKNAPHLVKEKDMNGRTPLHVACCNENGKPDIIYALIEHGKADIKEKVNGNYPFSRLQRMILNKETVDELVRIGCSHEDILVTLCQDKSPWKLFHEENMSTQK